MIEQPDPVAVAPSAHSYPLPYHKPVVTYILLAAIGVIFVLELLLRTLTGSDLIFALGAQQNLLVNAGQYWRLISAMFLHGGLAHLAFNALALYSLGLDLERSYGSARFLCIYILAGLGGGVLYYMFGEWQVPSVGASGAIFGIIGAELAYVLVNRSVFGATGRQRLKNILTLLVINAFINLAIPNLNKLAHIGGFIVGFLLGLALTPRYGLEWDASATPPGPVVVDRTSTAAVIGGVVVAVITLLLGLQYR